MGRRAHEALQQLGTNAIPVLLRMLASTNWDLAEAGFHALGEAARPAVPTLITMLDTNQTVICATFGAIGPAAEEAVPALLSKANLTNGHPALLAIQALGQIHSQPELVVPFLKDQLASCSSNKALSYGAAHCIRALACYREQAKEAIAAIEPFLTAREEYLRVSATNALERIDNTRSERAK